MRRFEIAATPLPGVTVVERQLLGDERGYLARLFCSESLREAGWDGPVAQINHTFTARRGTVRGMHFQRPPHAEIKLVSCIRGTVFDVVVDLRAGSPTYLRWYGTELSAANRRALLVPMGCAHGFQTLTENCELVYVHSAPYIAASEGGVDALDPRLAIAWPEVVATRSARDESHPPITDSFQGIET